MKQLSKKNPDIIFLSMFYIGFIPWAPGTFASLATLPLLVLASHLKTPSLFFIPLLVVLTALSCYAADVAQKKYNLKDPSWIVIDEFLGMMTGWICLNMLLTELSWQYNVLHFCLFRFFDIVKFWPASYFDKRVAHGAGVILDDIVSGIYSFFSSYLIILLFNKIIT